MTATTISTKPTKQVVWRIGIQNWAKDANGKKRPYWTWSNGFKTLDETQEFMIPWIKTHPGCVISYRTEEIFI